VRRLIIIENLNNAFYSRYGIFFSFSGYTNKKFKKFKDLLYTYKCDTVKAKSKLFSLLFVGDIYTLHGHTLYTFANNFNHIYKFLIDLKIEEGKTQFFLTLIKIKKNLLNIKFFKTFILCYDKIIEMIKNKIKFIYLLNNLLNYNKYKFIKFESKLNFILLKLLKI
jgi:hypothetical protein